MKTFIQLLITFSIIIILSLYSCRKDENIDSNSPQNTITANHINTTISGQVTDESGQPISGVVATVDGNSATTSANGLFLIKKVNVKKERCLIKLIKSGYVDQYYATYPYSNDITYIKAILLKVEGTFNIASASGGSVTLADGSSAIFPTDAFALVNGSNYSGQVTVKMNYINADDTQFKNKTPGRDLRAVAANGEDKILLSFGMMNIELFGSSGEKLNLAAGKSATLTFPIANSQSATAPTVIPLWYLDISTGLWREEGAATKSGNIYNCNVNHFTWWNCDISYGIASISGYVKSCSGMPMPNIDVYADFSNAYTTNSMGYYKGAAPSNYGNFDLWAMDNNFNISQQITIPNLYTGQAYSVADLLFVPTVQSSSLIISGTITDCDNFPTSGLVIVTSSQGVWQYQLTGINGQFNYFVAPGFTYTINASSGNLVNQYTLTPALVGSCDHIDIGIFPLCNTINTGNSNFTATVITAQFGTQTFNYEIDHCSVTTNNSISASTIALTSTDAATNITSDFVIKVSDFQPGNYTWNASNNSLSFDMVMNSMPVSIVVDLSSNGGNTIAVAANQGGNVDASFSGPVLINSPQLPGGQISGYITGNFNVFRNY
jgi:hypothetical protein